MDFEKEYELESAGIDAFEFSLMDEDERREVLEDNYLDPDDFDMIDLDPEFQAWEDLQNAGMDLSDLSMMDEDEKKEALENAGLDPSDYGIDLVLRRSFLFPVLLRPNHRNQSGKRTNRLSKKSCARKTLLWLTGVAAKKRKISKTRNLGMIRQPK